MVYLLLLNTGQICRSYTCLVTEELLLACPDTILVVESCCFQCDRWILWEALPRVDSYWHKLTCQLWVILTVSLSLAYRFRYHSRNWSVLVVDLATHLPRRYDITACILPFWGACCQSFDTQTCQLRLFLILKLVVLLSLDHLFDLRRGIEELSDVITQLVLCFGAHCSEGGFRRWGV